MPNRSIASTNVAATHFVPFPLPPASIRSGTPDAQVHWLRTSGEGEPAYFAGIWTVQPCVFDYLFELDETAHILEGEAVVTQQGGPTLQLRPGDVATFPKGAVTVWDVRRALKKVFVDTAG